MGAVILGEQCARGGGGILEVFEGVEGKSFLGQSRGVHGWWVS